MPFKKNAAYDFLNNSRHNWRKFMLALVVQDANSLSLLTSDTKLKGFKLLTLGWSDGASFLPLDFILCSSADAEKRMQGIKKALDKRTCGYHRRLEAISKSTEHLETLVKSLMEALQRLLAHALDKVRSSGAFAENVVIAMIDAIMVPAIEVIQSSRRLMKNTGLFSIG